MPTSAPMFSEAAWAELVRLLPDVGEWQTLLGAWLPAVMTAVAVVGVAMLLWGRLLHRGLLVLLAAGAGLVLGGHYGRQIGLNVLLGQLAGAISLGLLGLVLARLVWAVMAGVHVAAVAAGLVAALYLGVQLAPVATQPAMGGDLVAHGRAAVEHLAAALTKDDLVTLNVAMISAGVAGLIVAFLLPRAAVVVMTSLLGAGLLSVPLAVATRLWVPPLDRRDVALGITGGLLVVGVLFQVAGAMRGRRKGQEEDDEQAEGKTRRKAPSEAED